MITATLTKDDVIKKIDSLILEHGLDDKIRDIISKNLSEARTTIQQDIKGSLENDPHEGYKAVKKMIYKRIIGGNLSILNRKRSGSLSSQRSGRTAQINSYKGEDRGFILRFVNSGTFPREKRNGSSTGSIAPRHFFQPSAESAVAKAVEEICLDIEKLFSEI